MAGLGGGCAAKEDAMAARREMIFYIEREMPRKKKIVLPIRKPIGAHLRHLERRSEKVLRGGE
jgi:hypothetical protein